MTDDRGTPAGPPPEPPAPQPGAAPAPPAAVRRARSRPWGWIVAALLALVLIVLVILYFMGMFEGEQRREEVPWNSGYAEPDPARTAPSAAWLAGTWGPRCPGARQRAVTFSADGRYSAEDGAGTWSLSGDVVTVTVNGRSRVTRWERVVDDGAWKTEVATGEVRYVRRCP